MFKFLKRRKAERNACKKIGIELHRQIKEALDQNEGEAAARLQTSFTVGYIYSFVRTSFSTLGFDEKQKTDKYMKLICDGVIPKKLYDIFQRQSAAIVIAQGMEDKNKIIRGTTITPADVAKLFKIGAAAGMFDATSSRSKVNSLERYLLGEKVGNFPLSEDVGSYNFYKHDNV